MLATLVAAVCVLLVVLLADQTRLRTRAAANTRDYENARYLAEAGLQHGFSLLEEDIGWRAGLSGVTFPNATARSTFGLPADVGGTYSVTAADGPDGTVLVRAEGTVTTSRGPVTRVLEATIKQGG